MSQAHLARLSEAMAPDPGEWRFEGEVTDAGGVTAKCACGANIRFMFWISRSDGAKLAIGSVCIEKSVPWLIERGAGRLAENLTDALARHKDALDEARRDAKLAVAAKQLEGVVEDARMLAAWIDVERRERWVPSSCTALARKASGIGDDPDVREQNTLAGMLGSAVADLAMSERTRDRFPAPLSEAGMARALATLRDRHARHLDDAERHEAAASEGRSVAWNADLASTARRKMAAIDGAIEAMARRKASDVQDAIDVILGRD